MNPEAKKGPIIAEFLERFISDDPFTPVTDPSPSADPFEDPKEDTLLPFHRNEITKIFKNEQILGEKKHHINKLYIPKITKDDEILKSVNYVEILSKNEILEPKATFEEYYISPNEGKLSSRYTQIIGQAVLNSYTSPKFQTKKSSKKSYNLFDPFKSSVPPIIPQPQSQPFSGLYQRPSPNVWRGIYPEDLPEMAVPILEFMDEAKPHVVIGCDRGGRLFGLAVHATWQHARQGKPFPTMDGKVHFTRVSKSEDERVLQEGIDRIVNSSLNHAERRGQRLAENERLRVMFIDDWVIGGGTKRLAERLMKKYDAKTYFAVMCGDGGDVTGSLNRQTNVSWHDIPEEIGVNYLSTLIEDTGGNVNQQLKVIAVRDTRAKRNRRMIHSAARDVAAQQLALAA